MSTCLGCGSPGFEPGTRCDLCEERYAVAEKARAERWHATYNAAVTAVWYRVEPGSLLTKAKGRRSMHRLCCQIADSAHGKLKP